VNVEACGESDDRVDGGEREAVRRRESSGIDRRLRRLQRPWRMGDLRAPDPTTAVRRERLGIAGMPRDETSVIVNGTIPSQPVPSKRSIWRSGSGGRHRRSSSTGMGQWANSRSSQRIRSNHGTAIAAIS
jgi:hypothetical protein